MHPILYIEITKNTVQNSGIMVILFIYQWYNAVTPCDPGLHHWEGLPSKQHKVITVKLQFRPFHTITVKVTSALAVPHDTKLLTLHELSMLLVVLTPQVSVLFFY